MAEISGEKLYALLDRLRCAVDYYLSEYRDLDGQCPLALAHLQAEAEAVAEELKAGVISDAK